MSLTRFITISLIAFALSFGLAQAQGLPKPPPQPQAQAQPVSAAPAINKDELKKRVYQDVGVDIDVKATEWSKRIDDVEQGMRGGKVPSAQLNTFRDLLQKTRAEADELGAKLPPRIDGLKAQVEKLGPAPAADQPPEPDQTTTLRAELNYQLGLLEGAQRQLNNINVRINQNLSAILDARRNQFTNYLFTATQDIYKLETWEKAQDSAWPMLETTQEILLKWWNEQSDKDAIRLILAEGALVWLVLTALGWLGVHRLWRWHAPDEPPFWRRASSAAGVIVLRSLPITIAVLFVYLAIDAHQPFPPIVGWLFYGAARLVIVIVTVSALLATVFAPSQPHWRLIAASTSAAIRIYILGMLLAFTYAASLLITIATYFTKAPLSISFTSTFIANLLAAVLVIAILRTRLHGKENGATPQYVKILRWPIWLLAFAVIVIDIAAYLGLSRFLLTQLIVNGSILAVVYLLLLWVDGLSQGIADEQAIIGNWLFETFGLEQRRREQLAVPISLFLKFAILIGSVPLIMLQWGYPWTDIMDWYQQLFFGFQIGNTQVSLAAFIASVVVFVVGYFAARMFQSWLDAQILKPAGLSGGLRDSIRTGVGYIGVFAAGLVALSYAGFSLSNFAIVAGAFSVGIGFGLQSVVSNFVSGLILLAERPIKIGDWVVAGGEEGIVRKISVRSTEIETFDRANVLIPNSAFITDKVKNWTLRNSNGRVTIAIQVAFHCDPRQVRDLLLKVAKNHLNVMTTPEPFVDFEDITPDSLTFKLYAFIYDINKSTSTRTDLRIGILEAFKEAGVTMPLRQTEITLHETEWLRDAINHYVSANQKAQAAEAAPAVSPKSPAPDKPEGEA